MRQTYFTKYNNENHMCQTYFTKYLLFCMNVHVLTFYERETTWLRHILNRDHNYTICANKLF